MKDIINLKSKYINRYLIPINNDDYCLIDTGYKGELNKFLADLKLHGIAMEQIKYLIITHMHADHVGFARDLLRLTGAELIYDVNDKLRLEAGKNNMKTYVPGLFSLISSKISTMFVERTQTFPAVFYDNYADAKTQPLSDYGIEFIFLSGHTECDLCVKFEDKLFCGDICMNGILATKHAPLWISNKFNMLDSWRTIRRSDDIKIIYPSHGKPFAASELDKCIDYWKNKGVLPLFSHSKTRWI